MRMRKPLLLPSITKTEAKILEK